MPDSPTRRAARLQSRRQQSRRRRSVLAVAIAFAVALTGVAVAPALAGTPSTNGIFADSLTPKIAADPDRTGVELGVKFTPQRAGSVTAIQYYQGKKATGVTTATLWSSSGKALARVSFSATSTAGWRTIPLKTSVAIAAGSTYTVSYFAPKGGYVVTENDLTRSRTVNGFSLSSGAGVYKYAKSSQYPSQSYRGSNYLVDIVFTPGGKDPAQNQPRPEPTETKSPTPQPSTPSSPTPSPTQTATPTPTPTPTQTPSPSPTPTTSPSDPPASNTGGQVVLGRSFPNSATTGVPSGTTLTKYTGSCTITASNVVIDGKTIDCYLRVTGKNLTIKNSVITGAIFSTSGSFTVTDSEIRLSAQEDTGVGEANFTLNRVEITGGRRSVNCASNCTVQNSFIHAQGKDSTGEAHQSGIRMGANSVIRGNTITCDAPESPPAGGCSAALTGYGDFDIVQDNTIDGNLFLASNAGYCAYGGSSPGKPYSAGVNNVKFTNNIFQRGKTGDCGFWGPIVAFDRGAPGNVWSNNVYDDGKSITP